MRTVRLASESSVRIMLVATGAAEVVVLRVLKKDSRMWMVVPCMVNDQEELCRRGICL